MITANGETSKIDWYDPLNHITFNSTLGFWQKWLWNCLLNKRKTVSSHHQIDGSLSLSIIIRSMLCALAAKTHSTGFPSNRRPSPSPNIHFLFSLCLSSVLQLFAESHDACRVTTWLLYTHTHTHTHSLQTGEWKGEVFCYWPDHLFDSLTERSQLTEHLSETFF